MKELLMDLLVCPACLPEESPLTCRAKEKAGDEVIQGKLICGSCGALYSIRKGIANLLPGKNRTAGEAAARYENPKVLASYLWAHYGDLMGEENANSCYHDWASLLTASSGFSLDAGCAVGRFTFEMSRKSDFAVGVDASFRFVETARQLMKDGRLTFPLPVEGRLDEQRTIFLPPNWASEKVEFVVGDVQAIPFRAGLFPSLASLNMVDKVPLPLQHLRELNRVATRRGAQLAFSDPFSWSEDVSHERDWLGGTRKGPFAGRAMGNVKGLLEGEGREIAPPWEIKQTGDVWWRIRTHQNHFELIRSCFIQAER